LGLELPRFFRQALQLPFINGNDSRMIPNTFEAYQFEAVASEDFRLNFGYVTHMKSRTSASFEPMSNVAGAPQVNRGTGFGGFVLGSQQNAFLGAIEELTWDHPGSERSPPMPMVFGPRTAGRKRSTLP
jgi:hypothetical protein